MLFDIKCVINRVHVKRLFVILLSALLIFAGTSEMLIGYSTEDITFAHLDHTPHNKVGLLLGTTKWMVDGRENLYYRYRLDAAVALFKAGKIDYILVSGDNATRRYNEPMTINNDLVDAGIPPRHIYLDYAGFRTLDSVIRSKAVFGQSRLTIISQGFHNQRALFIAHWHGIDAVGFNARDVGFWYGLKTQIRERFARIKMMFDLVFGVQPKFLGESIAIP